MQRAIVVLILIIVGIGIYLFNQNADTSTDSTQAVKPKAIDEPVAPKVKAAAQEHIEKLTTDSKEQVLDITKADNFVTGEQLLAMPTMQSETINIERVGAPSQSAATSLDDQSLAENDTSDQSAALDQGAVSADDRASTNNRASSASSRSAEPTRVEVTQVMQAVKERLAADAAAGVQAVEPTSQLVQGSVESLKGQSIVVTQGTAPAVQFEVTDQSGNIEVSSTKPGTSLRPGQRIRLQELLSDPDLAAGTVFYIHAVSPNDEQGLWGILQHGLIKTFAQGIELKESGRVLTAEIPMLADETLENRRSSFLGEFLYQKVNDTYVYNYQQGMLGQDPDLIKPGQQLIIVSYTEDELINIFNHFTRPGA